jgi:F-type H+-transporting ATPase subunit delta
VNAYRDRLADHQNIIRGSVTTAEALPPDRIGQIQRTLSDATGRSVTLTAHVDPGLIGGVVARIGGTVYDASLTTQLARMRQRLGDSL